MSAEDINTHHHQVLQPPPSEPLPSCSRECFCFHQNHRIAPTKRQRPRSPTQSAGCAHVEKVKPESSLCSPTCAGIFVACVSGHSRTGTNSDRKAIINPLLQEDETNPDKIYLSRIKKKKQALITGGCVAPPLLFAQEQNVSIPSTCTASAACRL